MSAEPTIFKSKAKRLCYRWNNIKIIICNSYLGLLILLGLRMALFDLLVFVSAFLCCLTKKRRQRKQKIFLFEEKKHLLKKSPSTNLPLGQPFLLEVVFRATSTAQALSVTSLSLLKITSKVKRIFSFLLLSWTILGLKTLTEYATE